MSLKGVELQIALPKTYDAGKVAEQHQQNIIQQQLHANEELKKEVERKQLTVIEAEHTEKITDEKQQEHDSHDERSLHKKHQKKGKEAVVKHPFKGNFIDYSG